jgi:hypothetical protein
MLPSANAPWTRTIAGFPAAPTATDVKLSRNANPTLRKTRASVFIPLQLLVICLVLLLVWIFMFVSWLVSLIVA